MDKTNENNKDLESRVKRLENVIIFGVGFVIVGLLILFLTKNKNGSPSLSDGGSINTPNIGGGDISGSGVSNTVV